MVPLARALVAGGHDVAFATAGQFCSGVERAGFSAFAAGMSLADQLETAGQRYPEARLPPGKQRFESFVPRMLAGVAAPSRAADLMPVIARWKPDLLVHDETEFGGPAAAAASGIPWADQSVGILRPLSMARLAAETLGPLWREWGLDLGHWGGLFRWLYLDVCPPSLQSHEIAQVPVAHPVHNLAGPGTAGELPPWVVGLPPQPTVYVSLGTVFNRDRGVFTAILEGLREEPVNVVVTVGHDNDPADLGAQPPHVHVERFIPQSLLLPHCDVVVNQGGTAILDILGHGLPILVLPQGANQFHNAEAVVLSGAGRALLPGDVSPASVRRELRTLLGDRRFSDRAARLGDELAAMPGPAEGVRLLERLAAERVPLARAGQAGS